MFLSNCCTEGECKLHCRCAFIIRGGEGRGKGRGGGGGGGGEGRGGEGKG